MKQIMIHTDTTQIISRSIQDCANQKQDWNGHSPPWTQVIVFNTKHVFSSLEVGYARVYIWMLCRVALWTQMVEQRINSEV